MMLENKVAVITGGAAGIGRSIALTMAKEGANIAILDVCKPETAEEGCALIAETGVTVKFYHCDVSNFELVDSTIKQVIADMGGVDILVNNAGITRDALLVSMKEADFDAVIAINLKGVFNTIHACYHHFMRKRSGRIINISSVTGLMGNPGQANYTAAKAGIIGLTKTTAKELASRGVTCNAIAPGFIQTAMTDVLSDKAKAAMLNAVPMKRMGQPEDIAKTALYLASDLSSYVTGEVIRVDGGMCM